jgi:aromatic ring-opening dioxygenase catalytic subunit (LigB family)
VNNVAKRRGKEKRKQVNFDGAAWWIGMDMHKVMRKEVALLASGKNVRHRRAQSNRQAFPALPGKFGMKVVSSVTNVKRRGFGKEARIAHHQTMEYKSENKKRVTQA